MRLILAAAAPLVLIAGCSESPPTSSANVQPKPTLSRLIDPSDTRGTTLEYRTHLENVADLKRLPSELVVGTVVGERRGQTIGLPDDRSALRYVQFKVERVFKGAVEVGETIEFETLGWQNLGMSGERRVPDADGLTLQIGDRLVVGLAKGAGATAGRRGLASGQAALLLDQGQVVDTGRPDPFVRAAEGLSEGQLFEALGRATS